MPVRWTTKELKNKSDDEVIRIILAERMSGTRPEAPLHKRLQKIVDAADRKITDKQDGEPIEAAAMPRVVVRIQGGNFQGASANMFVDLSILDIDNMEACDPVLNEWELNYYRGLEQEVEELFPIH
jgi:hypothetical protein